MHPTYRFSNDLKLKKVPVSYSFIKSYSLNFLLYTNNLMLDLSKVTSLSLNDTLVSVEHIKVQELTFLSEYFLITALFCLTLFVLFTIKIVVSDKNFLVKFQYSNQLVFLLIFILSCYLILVYQQMQISLLMLTSFNDTIFSDQLSLISRLIIGVTSVLYLLFTTQYLKSQKLNNFEYYIVLLTSIFGFFLLCCVNDFITAYLAIELQGLAFYVLASFKKSSNFSIESGVKYFVLGSLSTALFLLGVSFIYGLSGSIFMTDFKDFFIWVFSVNSFFLSFESISQALEFFQEKIPLTENPESGSAKLQVMFDKLNFLGKHADPLNSKMNFFNTILKSFSTTSVFPNDTGLYYGIEEKFLEFYSKIDSVSFLSYLKNPDLLNENYLRITTYVFSLNDFLIENWFKDAFIELLYVLQDGNSDYHNFINFKTNLLQANFYENVDMSSSSEFSNLFQIGCNFIGDTRLSSVYDALQCCYFSECVANTLQFADYLQTTSTQDESLTNNVFVKDLLTFSDDFELQNTQSSILSVTSIVNLHTFFLEFSALSSMQSSFMFDLDFVVFGLLIVILALFFKLALAPFHLWAPDVYEGSPSSSTFFFMVISKFSIFVFLLRICYSSFYSLISYWQFYSIIVATVSIFVGAVAGLKQRRLKSLLTYSSINNMGFVLLAFSVGGFEGVQVHFYYLIVYMLASLCIWSIILNMQKISSYTEKQNRDLGDFALLQESHNAVAQSLGITLFSLAGLPPMVGFLAKMGVFKALSGVSIYYFSVVNILFSVIATFYYLRITKIIFFENILVGNLYTTISSKKTFIINLLIFLLLFLFINPMFLYFFSYKMSLLLNKSFF